MGKANVILDIILSQTHYVEKMFKIFEHFNPLMSHRMIQKYT
jgi:hypothetical protein